MSNDYVKYLSISLSLIFPKIGFNFYYYGYRQLKICVVFVARWAFFGSGEEMDFWEIIHRFAHPATITSVNDMENILSDLGRVSANTEMGEGVPVNFS